MRFLAKSLLLCGLIVAGKLVKQQPSDATITITRASISVETSSTPAVSFFTQQLYPRVVSVQASSQPWRITPAYFTTSNVVGE